MAIGNFQGRARTSLSNPKAKGECDNCGFWYPLRALKSQDEWAGRVLIDTGSLVCARCYSTPQEQFRTIILPGDPQPVPNPRVSQDAASAAIGGSNDVVSSTGVVSDPATLVSGT